MSRVRKALSAIALVWSLAPGVGLLLFAAVLALAGASATLSLYLALVGLGLLVIGWVRLNW